MGHNMIFAVINTQTNIVNNTIVLDDGVIWTAPQGYYTVNTTGTDVGIGWTYNPQTSEWTSPIEPESNLNVNQAGTQPDVIA
jgi:hypothetical protein